MEIRRTLRCLGTAGVFIAGSCCPSLDFAVRDTEVIRKSAPAPMEEARKALGILLRGNPVCQREAAEEAQSTFQILDAIDCQNDGFHEILDSLERIVRTERDDWIASLLLQNLGELNTDCLNPLYLRALESRSPNLRWRGVQWFADHRDLEAVPFLQDAWRNEKRPWVRIDLLDALAENGASDLGPEILEVAEHGSPSLSRAAFEALRTMGAPGVVPDLVRLTRKGKTAVRAEAVSTLASWLDSGEALTAVLDATGAEEPEVRERAIDALGQFPNPQAVDRTLDLARSGNPRERSAALRALEDLQPPEAIPVLADLLHESFPEGAQDLRGQAIQLLSQLDDPAAILLLRDLDPELGGQGPLNLQDLLESLSRDRSSEARRSLWIRTSCMTADVDDDPENPVGFVVVPPDGWLTIRCWEYPGVAGDPEDFERIPGGASARVEDHYEAAGDSWVMILTPDSSEDCWVPRRLLQPSAGEEGFEGPVETPGRKEFDLPEAELQSEAAGSLIEMGLLKVIDPGEEVAGVRLEADAVDPEGLAALLKSCRNDGSILDGEIQEVLETLGLTCPGRAEGASRDEADSPDEEDSQESLDDD